MVVTAPGVSGVLVPFHAVAEVVSDPALVPTLPHNMVVTTALAWDGALSVEAVIPNVALVKKIVCYKILLLLFCTKKRFINYNFVEAARYCD